MRFSRSQWRTTGTVGCAHLRMLRGVATTVTNVGIGHAIFLFLCTYSSEHVLLLRSGYTPTDYPSESQWDARLLVERSTAIKVSTCRRCDFQ